MHPSDLRPPCRNGAVGWVGGGGPAILRVAHLLSLFPLPLFSRCPTLSLPLCVGDGPPSHSHLASATCQAGSCRLPLDHAFPC